MITAVSRTLGSGQPAKALAPVGDTKFSNRHRTAVNEYPKRATGVFSNVQKARLALLAKRAFLSVHGRDPRDTAEEAAFRHGECAKACGKPGLTQCVQDDYKVLESWFLDLAGQHGAAFEAQIAHGTEPKRVALAKLEEECESRGLTLGYVVTIARAQFKRELSECTTNQLWKLMFTVRMRKRADRKKQINPDNEPF